MEIDYARAPRVALVDEDTVDNFPYFWSHADLAAKVGPALTCSEADSLAETLAVFGDSEGARMWLVEHARSDEEDDRHFHLRDDSHPAPDPADALAPTLRKALALFTTVWAAGDMADEIGPKLQCEEVKALAILLEAAGEADAARTWIDFHAVQDDEGDTHHDTSKERIREYGE
ncbi:hypothetical protein [Nocardiopsis sp. YSL2]|uniref:hypothetical protein n=1 Tax=Nocardiopsis sp. YSL2 TaxID=2939492 RepID=UPI0026F434C3|nr:hypothetical protein [Nocardiopsis sp. YSL2]